MRYYIEVTAECAEELKRIGVSPDNIMVVDEASRQKRHSPLLKALEEVTGVAPARIFSNERTRYVVMARTIYTHYAKIDGDGIEQIAADMGKNRWNTNYYLRDYYNKLQGDMEFRKAEMRVSELLAADPEWSPPKVVKPAIPHKKRHKGRGKAKKRKTIKLMAVKMPKQLEILFEK